MVLGHFSKGTLLENAQNGAKKAKLTYLGVGQFVDIRQLQTKEFGPNRGKITKDSKGRRRDR